jgi:hypothetical protein
MSWTEDFSNIVPVDSPGLYLDLFEHVLIIKIHYILSKVLYLLSSRLWKGN